MKKIEYPVYQPKKRNILISSCIGVIGIFSMMLAIGYFVSNGFINSNFGIGIYGVSLVSYFYLLDKYYSTHQTIGQLVFNEQTITIQKNDKKQKFHLNDLKGITCYYYYSNHKFGFIYQLQKIIDMDIHTEKQTFQLVCPVLIQDDNIIELLKSLPTKVTFAHERRR